MDALTVRAIVLDKVASLGGVTADQVNDETTLESLGLDSADAVVLAMEIEQLTGAEIEVGIFLRCATVAEAAGEIGRIVGGEKPVEASGAP
jgi:acyl carrier protein